MSYNDLCLKSEQNSVLMQRHLRKLMLKFVSIVIIATICFFCQGGYVAADIYLSVSIIRQSDERILMTFSIYIFYYNADGDWAFSNELCRCATI